MRKAEKLIIAIKRLQSRIRFIMVNMNTNNDLNEEIEALDYGIKILKAELSTCPIDEQKGICDKI